jgi:tetratricopeptide (TPR) repeat protein
MVAHSNAPPWADIDPFVEAYERQQARDGHADLAAFLPPPRHPLYLAVLRELVRADLEYGWGRGRPRRVEDYLAAFPELRRDRDGLQAIAFEEYRLRRQAGEAPAPAEYRERLGVDPGQWPAAEEERSSPRDLEAALAPLPDAEQYAELFRGLYQSDPGAACRLAQALTAPPAAGTDFLGFRLLRELGRGAFGRVYLARQGDLADRLVALKVAGDLLGESQTLAQLQHTNIVPIYSVHRAGPFQALCMPYFGATTLADVFGALRALPALPTSGRWLVDLLAERRGRTSVAPEGRRRVAPGESASPGVLAPEGRRRVAPGESASPGIEEALDPPLAPEGRRSQDHAGFPPPLRGSERASASAESPGSKTRPGLTSDAPPGLTPPGSTARPGPPSDAPLGLTPPGSQTRPGLPSDAPPGLTLLAGRRYVDAVLWLACRLADGLAHAHERGILHQDLKPANVLLADDGQPMLLDFNLSADTKLRGSAAAAYVGGTLPYMAPEQLAAFRDGKPCADPRSDLYALGVILCEFLTGRYPFALHTGAVAAVLPRMLAERRASPPDPRRWNRAVPPALAAIVRRCLEPEPGRRYQTARQLHEDLERQRADRPLKHAAEPSLTERLRKWGRRHPRLAGYTVAAVAVVLLLGLGTLYSFRLRQWNQAQALNTFHDFQGEVRVSEFLLNGPAPDRSELDEGLAVARHALDRYRVLDDPVWESGPPVTFLGGDERGQLRRDLGELLLFVAGAEGAAAEASAAGPRDVYVREALRLNALAERVFREEDGHRPLLLQRAGLLRLEGHGDEAADVARQAEALPLRTARDCYLAAHQALRQEQYRQALGLLREAKRLEPQDPYVYYALGACHLALADFPKAAACLDTSIALWPKFYRSHYLRAGARLELKEYDQALADFDEAIRLRPDYLPAYIDRALARAAHKDHAGAVADVTHALDAGGPPTRLYFLRAYLRQQAGDAEGARRDRAEGLRHEPTDERGWIARALARLATDPPGALADLDEALKLNARSREALEDKAHVLSERLGRTEDAVRVLDQAVALYPDYVPARAGRGVLLARLGRREAALRDAEEALRLDTRPATRYQVAGIYALSSRQHADDRLEAFRLLSSALRSGYGFELLEADPDLEVVRRLPEFRRLVAAAQALRAGTPAGRREP